MESAKAMAPRRPADTAEVSHPASEAWSWWRCDRACVHGGAHAPDHHVMKVSLREMCRSGGRSMFTSAEHGITFAARDTASATRHSACAGGACGGQATAVESQRGMWGGAPSGYRRGRGGKGCLLAVRPPCRKRFCTPPAEGTWWCRCIRTRKARRCWVGSWAREFPAAGTSER
jgi:hypothetical protein